MTKALIECCLNVELHTHLEEQRQTPESPTPKNRHNGHSKKTLKGEFGQVDIAVPRDRQGEFEPVIVPKGQTRFAGFDEKILALHARGMTTRDIQTQLQKLYGVEVSPTLISHVTDAVETERKAWQNRTLDPVYPMMYLDAIVVKVRQEGRVINKAIHLAKATPLTACSWSEYGRSKGIVGTMDDSN